MNSIFRVGELDRLGDLLSVRMARQPEDRRAGVAAGRLVAARLRDVAAGAYRALKQFLYDILVQRLQ